MSEVLRSSPLASADAPSAPTLLLLAGTGGEGPPVRRGRTGWGTAGSGREERAPHATGTSRKEGRRANACDSTAGGAERIGRGGSGHERACGLSSPVRTQAAASAPAAPPPCAYERSRLVSEVLCSSPLARADAPSAPTLLRLAAQAGDEQQEAGGRGHSLHSAFRGRRGPAPSSSLPARRSPSNPHARRAALLRPPPLGLQRCHPCAYERSRLMHDVPRFSHLART
jgi:hypothetical protein